MSTVSLDRLDSPVDAREAARVVASVLLAAGTPSDGAMFEANGRLRHLGLAPMSERDFVVSTPEELAPLVPAHLRDAIADLVLDIAGDEPLRRRVAFAYVNLWKLTARQPLSSKPAIGERALRAVMAPIPRHQHGGDVPEERETVAQAAIYRVDERLRAEPSPVDPLRARVARVRDEMNGVIAAVDRVVIGKHEVVTRALLAMAARGHVLLVDAPGVGKTLLCKTMAAALGARFGRVQLTPDLMPMDVTGATIYEARSGQFVFRPGPVFTNFLLADEINRATPKTQSALLEVMEERTVTIDGTSHPMADPFQVLATMNPLDHEGTFPLPAAQIDRFMVMLEVGYPSIDDEVRVLDTHLAGAPAGATAPVIAADAFVEWQRTVPLVFVSPEVKRAAVTYVDGLRRQAPNGHTVSPRATLAWMRLAQARAILAGREFVTVEDLLDVAPEVLRHRLWVSAPEVRDRLRAIGLGNERRR